MGPAPAPSSTEAAILPSMANTQGLRTPDPNVRSARALARVLDSAVGIPGTKIRIGLDALLGLIPGGGDVAAAALSGYIVLTAARRGVPRTVLARMLLNVLVDTAVGAIPVLGDLFDVGYKANMRNVDLLERHDLAPGTARRQSKAAIAAVVAAIAIIALGVGVLAFFLARLLWNALAG
jgi:hypothetical protein